MSLSGFNTLGYTTMDANTFSIRGNLAVNAMNNTTTRTIDMVEIVTVIDAIKPLLPVLKILCEDVAWIKENPDMAINFTSEDLLSAFQLSRGVNPSAFEMLKGVTK